jgi:hypothetical protein
MGTSTDIDNLLGRAEGLLSGTSAALGYACPVAATFGPVAGQEGFARESASGMPLSRSVVTLPMSVMMMHDSRQGDVTHAWTIAPITLANSTVC